jgi:hypothetical protein
VWKNNRFQPVNFLLTWRFQSGNVQITNTEHAMKRLFNELDATDVRDMVLISLFIGTLMVWAAIGAGA